MQIPAVRLLVLGPVWEHRFQHYINGRQTGLAAVCISHPAVGALDIMRILAAEAVGSAVAATLVGTVPAAITPLAKSTSYPKFDRSG